MRLLITTGLFYPAKLGGPANTLFWLSKALVKNGIDVSVVASNHTIDPNIVPFDTWTDVDGIRVRYCTTKGKYALKIRYYSFKEMKNCDVVMLSSICYLANFPVAIWAAINKKKIIWSPRGELLGSALNGEKTKLLYFKVIKSLIGKHIIFHATSEEEKQSVLNVFGDDARVKIISNYMELPRKEDRNEKTTPYLLYVGRIAPIKALDNLIKGMAKSNMFNQSNYSLKIVGGVEEQFQGYYEALQKLVSENKLNDKIEFVGPLNGKEKFQTYANAYFTFLVSHSENFGNVVIESLSQGTPVVASKGTPWSGLVDNQAGFWIENTPEEIANIVDEVLSMPKQEYISLKTNAYGYGSQFDIYSNINCWKKFILS